MMQFWIIAAGMLILALAFVIPPFLRTPRTSGVNLDELNLSVVKQQLAELDGDLANGDLDQAQYAAARKDLEKGLLLDIPQGETPAGGVRERSGRWAVGIAGIGVPVLAIVLYQALGNQEMLTRLDPSTEARTQPNAAATQDLPPMEVLVEKLAQRLQREPDNIEGWIMLGRSYLAMGQTEQARKSYETAYRLAPDNAQLLLNYAELLANIQDNRLSGRPAELVAKAVRMAPTNPNALWMMGLVHYEQNDFAQAAERWEQLAALLPAGSEDLAEITKHIADARSQVLPGAVPLRETVAATAPSSAGQQAATIPAEAQGLIRVTVSLDPKLRNKVQETDRVFIFARALRGPRMPLAAASRQVKDLPLRLTLDDSSAMTPQFVLSSFPQVVVGARVSKSGNAIPQSGDLQGEVSPVAPGREDVVDIVINSVRP